jgi:hypothetical protein
MKQPHEIRQPDDEDVTQLKATCAECSRVTPVKGGYVSRYLYETPTGPANLCSAKCERAYNGEEPK